MYVIHVLNERFMYQALYIFTLRVGLIMIMSPPLFSPQSDLVMGQNIS